MFNLRQFLFLVMLSLAVGAGYFAWRGWEWFERLETWKAAHPASFAIDLSKPGITEGTLNNIASLPCHHIIYVRLETDQKLSRELLDGLSGEIDFLDEHKESVWRYEVNHQRYSEWMRLPAKSLELAYDRPVNIGIYTVRFHVKKPAMKLAGIPQQLEMQYELCGIEQGPGVVYNAIAIFCGAISLGFCLYLYSTRKSTPLADDFQKE